MRRNGVQRAEFRPMRAALSGEYGLGLLARKFGEDGAAIILETFGMYSRGPRKGLPRGYIHWVKCAVGGWTYAFTHDGSVLTPGSHRYRVTLSGIEDEKTSIKPRTHILPESATDSQWQDAVRKMAVALTRGKRP